MKSQFNPHDSSSIKIIYQTHLSRLQAFHSLNQNTQLRNHHSSWQDSTINRNRI